MNLRGMSKVVTELNAHLRIYKFTGGLTPKYVEAKLDTQVSKDISLLNKQLCSLSLCKSQTEKFCLNLPILDGGIKKQIIDPNRNVKLNFELPIKNPNKPALDLPLHIEKDITEPGKVISKKAVHILVIRRRKMRKHKRKKYLKKYRIELELKKLHRESAKEEVFQKSLKSILEEMNGFSAEKYVEETLEKANWERPITKVRGRLAPQWVIKEHIKSTEEKRILKERLEECSK